MTNAQNKFSGRVIGVDSGDTIRVRLATLEMTVRLHGVESPTSPESLQNKAREYTTRRVENHMVQVEVRGTGAKQMVYGEVYPEPGVSLNQELIRIGLASWARQYAPNRSDLEQLEQEAQDRKRGMWGDISGASITLPPIRPTPSPATPKPTARPTVRSTAPAMKASPYPSVIATSSPTVTHTPVPTSVSPTRPAPSSSAFLDTLVSPPIVISLTFVLLLIILTVVQRFGPGGAKGLLPAQIIVSGLGSAGVTLLLPLILLLVSGKAQPDTPTLMTAILCPLIALCLAVAVGLFRRELVLRATPPTDIGSLPESGLVRISGRTSAPQGVVFSDVGNIPGIYVREQSFRYQSDTHSAVPTLRWYPRHHRTRTADFLLTDETGSVLVEASKATFYPLRVARFYNDIPVEKFFDQSYSGDLRSEVFFLPAEANVTVWGRCFTTATPFPGEGERRIGFDLLTETLIVVEENPTRVFTQRPLIALALSLIAGVLGLGIALCIAAPDLVHRLLPGIGVP